eukprot:6181866-Pleurochrysis_carterae.AAC.1
MYNMHLQINSFQSFAANVDCERWYLVILVDIGNITAVNGYSESLPALPGTHAQRLRPSLKEWDRRRGLLGPRRRPPTP